MGAECSTPEVLRAAPGDPRVRPEAEAVATLAGGDAFATCDIPALPTACEACIKGVCNELYAECAGAEACPKLVQCFQGCGDDDCATACKLQYPNATGYLGELGRCAGPACGEVCPLFEGMAGMGGGTGAAGTGGSGGACGGSFLTTACAPCAEANCLPGCETCMADAQCGLLFECIMTCFGSGGCIATCQNEYPAGLSLFDPLQTCLQQNCSADSIL